MAHFAKIDSNNIVLAVLTLDDSNNQNSEGVEIESIGQAYLEQNNNWPANQWIQTSYNTFENQHKTGGTPFRGNYAIISGSWDSVNNIFWAPRPYSSWVKNVSKAKWESPIGDKPSLTTEQENDPDNKWAYLWNESAGTWDLGTYTDPYME